MPVDLRLSYAYNVPRLEGILDGKPKFIVVSLTSVDGSPGRILTYPDGSIVIQKWDGRTWVTDKHRVAVPAIKETVEDETLADFSLTGQLG